jgi:hypothetical protein
MKPKAPTYPDQSLARLNGLTGARYQGEHN